jgi:hypothetical protein
MLGFERLQQSNIIIMKHHMIKLAIKLNFSNVIKHHIMKKAIKFNFVMLIFCVYFSNIQVKN